MTSKDIKNLAQRRPCKVDFVLSIKHEKLFPKKYQIKAHILSICKCGLNRYYY